MTTVMLLQPDTPSWHPLSPVARERPRALIPSLRQDLELQLSDEELEEMIRDADRTGCGQGVSEEEYLHILKNSTWM